MATTKSKLSRLLIFVTITGEILMIIYQDDPSFFDTSSAELKTIEFQSLDNTTSVSTVAACLTPAPKPLPMPNEQIDGGALHVLDGEK